MEQVSAPAAPPRRAERSRLSLWLPAVMTLLLIICAGAAFWLRQRTDGSGFQYYGQWIGSSAPDFTLTDQDGHPQKLSDLRGSAILMTFGFTHCPNICPTTLANLAAIRRALPVADQQRVKILFITIDPARDDAKAMKEYVGFYDPSFTGLTGSQDDIAKTAKAYGAYYEAVMQQSQAASNYYTMNHSDYVYLINPQGQYALLYNNDKLADHTRMDADIEHILATAPR